MIEDQPDAADSLADVRRALSEAEVDACFALEYHLKHVDTIFRRVFGDA